MNILSQVAGNPLLDVVVGIALVAFVIYRQFRTRSVKPKQLFIIPLILFYFSFQTLFKALPQTTPQLIYFIAAIVASIGTGLWRGMTFTIWLDHTTYLVRGTKITLLVWALTIVIRAGIDLMGAKFGVTESILIDQVTLFLAFTLLTQNIVICFRSIWKPYLEKKN